MRKSRKLLMLHVFFSGLSIGKTLPNEFCHAQLLEDAFYAIWQSKLGHQIRTKNLVVWTERAGRRDFAERKYSVKNGSITSALVRRLTDSIAFSVAVAINVITSFILATQATFLILKYTIPYFVKELRKIQILRAASHRLNHEVSGKKLSTNLPTVVRHRIWSRLEHTGYPCVPP